MQHYYVNKRAQSNGDHEVHVPRCSYLPDPDNCQYLGAFANCGDAVRAARTHFENSNGCHWCCSQCHSG